LLSFSQEAHLTALATPDRAQFMSLNVIKHETGMFTLTGPATDGPVAQCFPPHVHRILKFVVGSFRLGTILLIVGSILDPSYEMWE